MKKLPKFIKEEFNIPPDMGIGFFAAGISKPGYKFKSLDRKGNKAIIKFQRIDD